MEKVESVIQAARSRYFDFIASCRSGEVDYRLTPASEATPFARCFAVFGYHLLCRMDALSGRENELARALVRDCQNYWKSDARLKHRQQLLTFTLSALRLLGRAPSPETSEIVRGALVTDVAGELEKNGTWKGTPGTGNLAMFMAILLIHARDDLGIDTGAQIAAWVDEHLSHMNGLGFWGPAENATYHAFQNGYHQYEIFNYLGVKNPKLECAVQSVMSLADSRGHFAPVPGGGGCHDYDAVYILRMAGENLSEKGWEILGRTHASILGEQNPDGGFCESRSARHGAWPIAALAHGLRGPREGSRERMHMALRLLKPKNAVIQTHWTRYSRRWDESNLWDSWFRMGAAALSLKNGSEWGFIPFPGIGFWRV